MNYKAPSTKCSKCKARERREGQRTCLPCHRSEMRKYRSKRVFVLRSEAEAAGLVGK